MTAKQEAGFALHIAICDDQVKDIRTLVSLCAKYGQERGFQPVIEEFTSGQSLLASKRLLKYHAIMLDIYLVHEDGVEIARQLRATGYEGALIFTTSSTEHYSEGYSVNAAHYLTKPFNYADVSEALKRALAQAGFTQKQTHIAVTSERQSILLAPAQIRYIEVYDHNVTIHTMRYNLQTNMSLNQLEKLLAEHPFVRCHRSYAVNIAHIKALRDTEIYLLTGESIPISRRNKTEVKRKYMEYMCDTLRSNT